MRTLRISVRRLVEFLLRSGDIDSEGDWRGGIEVMQAGSEIHRMLQASGGASYQAEVSLASSIYFPEDSFNPHAARLDIPQETVSDQQGFFLRIEGRADGIIDDGACSLTIDEIKGVTRDVASIEEPAAIHEAQALCYAYLHLRSSRSPNMLTTAFGEQVVVRLTYASMTTGEVRQIERVHSVPDIEAWFFSLLGKAERWAAWRIHHEEERASALQSLTFPLQPRAGQQQIMDAVDTAIREDKRLYVQAPTGSGKTIATLYPALKAMGTGKVSRIAFLTAKTMTRRAALECIELLKQQGTAANVLVMTARDKMCPLRSRAHGAEMRARPLASLCNPVECPLARGHYDAVNDALFEVITTSDVLDFDHIARVAERHHVCPYELQRDAARWSDVIICDYHYAFAPSASLVGLSDEPGGDTVFLVDEAHNLAERMREMYSAELRVTDLKGLERLLRQSGGFGELVEAVHAVVTAFPAWQKDLPAGSRHGGQSRSRQPSYQVVRMSDGFSDALEALADGVDSAIEEMFANLGGVQGEGHARSAHAATHPGLVEVFLALRDADLMIRSFLGAWQRGEGGYVTFLGRSADGGGSLKVFCVNPRNDLTERLEQAKAAVFFSGTLLPMDYHRKLLAAQDGDPSVYARSAFDPSHLQVLIGADVSARFSKRGPKLYARITAYLAALTRTRPGNYLVFLPSYAMLEEVDKVLAPLTDARTNIVRQRPGMREGEREDFVARFRESRAAGTSLIGLCVLGGIFGESIDLPGQALVGVVVVGTGMPRTTSEREVIRDYYDAKEGKGFAYAFTYPGMSKVLQAAGRLIRTEEDRGIALLLDDRFLEKELQEAFPKEWQNVRVIHSPAEIASM